MNHRERCPAGRGAALPTAALLAIAPAQGQAPSSKPGQTPGPGQSAQSTPMPSPATSRSMVTQAWRSFVQQAASAGLAEVAAARLALERSQDAQVHAG